MIVVAIAIDVLQALLDFVAVGFWLDSLIDVFAALLFRHWFSTYGYSLGKRQSNTFLATILIGFVPGLNTAPEWTLFVWYSIREAHHVGGAV